MSTDHPQWATPPATDLFNGSPSAVGYWPVAGWGYLRVGNTAAATAAATSIRAAATVQGDAWPYTSGVAGQLILLGSGDISLVD